MGESLFVKHDEEKLNVNKIKENLTNITNKVFVLEQKKVEIDLILQKQLNEIEQINKMNMSELKNKQSLLHHTKMEYTKCCQKINILKAKYSTMAPSESGDGDNEHSQVYIMIKMAQTKQELQDKGNMLDAEIRKSEKELKLLFKSLKHLNHGNNLYRKSLHNQTKDCDDETNEDKDELEQMKMTLTNKYRKVSNSLLKNKETLKHLKHNIASNEHKMSLLSQQSETLAAHILKYQENDERLNKKLKQQKERLQRALNELKNNETENENDKLVQLKELKRKQKAIVDVVGYLDEIMQANNIHIDGLNQISSKKNDRSSSSSTTTTTISSAASSRPSTSCSTTSAISIVSLCPDFN